MCNCGSECSNCSNQGYIDVDGKAVQIFNNLFALLKESEYMVVLTKRAEDIKELQGALTLPKAIIGIVVDCGNFLDADENEVIEFEGKQYVKVETSALDEPTYLLMSEFGRILYQVYVKQRNGYHAASDKLFPTKKEAETYLKYSLGAEGDN